MTENPERFTGYAGESAARVWKAIYEENCFNIVHRMTEGCETCNNIMRTGTENPLKAVESVMEASKDFAHLPRDQEKLDQLLNDLAESPDGDGEEVCLEKRVYYRLISGKDFIGSFRYAKLTGAWTRKKGLHSSISIHICDEYFNKTTGEWVPNLDCFVTRIGSHPERLQNIYFTYALVMRAINKLGGYLEGYDFCTGDSAEEKEIKVSQPTPP